ncbi:MAG: hypothetical protein F9K18_00840 [Thermoanaerobaculia bacterium]|nr:MAG: hypothetical protein F9K18_00840 [Thermoanaerobaculia bacterium]
MSTNSGPNRILSAPDSHKIAEGLFLSAVTHWEEFCQALLVLDIATQAGGKLRKEVRAFRTTNAPQRLAELLVTHIDHPNGFHDWSDFLRVCARADAFLPSGHRFAPPPPAPPATQPAQKTALATAVVDDLVMFKRIRNAIAHKTDKAWESFMSLARGAPFNLQPAQRKGITPGRFLVSQQWSGSVAIHHALTTLETASKTLVP